MANGIARISEKLQETIACTTADKRKAPTSADGTTLRRLARATLVAHDEENLRDDGPSENGDDGPCNASISGKQTRPGSASKEIHERFRRTLTDKTSWDLQYDA